jgi:hypothetical protein
MATSENASRGKVKRRKSRAEARRTTPVDVQVGRNVRRRRIELGMSQTCRSSISSTVSELRKPK